MMIILVYDTMYDSHFIPYPYDHDPVWNDPLIMIPSSATESGHEAQPSGQAWPWLGLTQIWLPRYIYYHVIMTGIITHHHLSWPWFGPTQIWPTGSPWCQTASKAQEMLRKTPSAILSLAQADLIWWIMTLVNMTNEQCLLPCGQFSAKHGHWAEVIKSLCNGGLLFEWAALCLIDWVHEGGAISYNRPMIIHQFLR